MSDISGNDCNCAEIETLVAEVERLKGLKAELPPFPPSGTGLPRFGLRWNGPTQPLAVPMGDGYWTPFHLAAAHVATLTAERDAARAQLDHARFDGANGERARLLVEIDRLRTKYAQECREEEREAIARLIDAKAVHHELRAQAVSRGGPALHRKAAGSYRALAADIRARGL